MRTAKTLTRLGAQADLSLHWAHSHFVGFVMSWLKCENTIRHCLQHVDTEPGIFNLLTSRKEHAPFTQVNALFVTDSGVICVNMMYKNSYCYIWL